MTATERLRQLLDERGVEWYEPTTKPNKTWFPDSNGINCSARPWSDKLEIRRYGLTPEQAVEATLGRGGGRMSDLLAKCDWHGDELRVELPQWPEVVTVWVDGKAMPYVPVVNDSKCDTCEAMLDCDECLRADASHKELRGLQAENAKLRELVSDMMRFFEDGDYCTICEKAAECESLDEYGSDCLMRGVFRARMDELGIEVDA